MKLEKVFTDLVDIPGVPGQENYVRDYMRKELKKYSDEIVQDKLGGIFAYKRSKLKDAPVVMITGHMDEVGAIVTGITDTGMIKLQNLGGIDPKTFISAHMEVTLDLNNRIPGVIASVPPHLQKGNPDTKIQFKDLLLDIGAIDKEDAKKLGVKPGQMVTLVNRIVTTAGGNRVISKAWDNRYGCASVLSLLKKVKDIELDVTLVIGATVQEEVGLRGAVVATQMIKPDIFITMDASPANDIVKNDDSWGKLGGGFLLRFFDPGTIMHRGLREYFVKLADEKKIKYQYYISAGGTDAAAAQMANDGIIATALNIPSRYIHSLTSMISLDDHKAVQDMIFEFTTNINSNIIDEIRKNV